MAAPPQTPEAAILCGGLGTRLRVALPDLPKALAPVGGRPFLERVIEALTAARVARIVLCIGVGGEAIRRHFSGGAFSAEIVFSEESTPLGTGGALGLARAQLHSDPVLVLNGDSWVAGLDLEAFFRSYAADQRQRGAAGALVVVPRDERTDAGTIALETDGRIRGFAEKQETPGADYQSAGIYLLGRTLLEMIPAAPSSLERDWMPRWLAAGIHGYVHHGPLVDIGTPERLARAQERWA